MKFHIMIASLALMTGYLNAMEKDDQVKDLFKLLSESERARILQAALTNISARVPFAGNRIPEDRFSEYLSIQSTSYIFVNRRAQAVVSQDLVPVRHSLATTDKWFSKSPLYQAMKENDVCKFNEIFDDIKRLAYQDYPPLFLAIKDKKLDKVKELCDDVETCQMINEKYHNQTPLAYAMDNRKWEIAEYLILSDATVNVTCNNEGYTPLHLACISGKSTLVKLLLERHVDYEKLNHNNETALATCDLLEEESFDIAKLLICAGASMLTCQRNKSFIDAAYNRYEYECYKDKRAKVRSFVFEALKYAIEHNDLNRFKELIDHDTPAIKAGLIVTDENNNSLLHLIAYKETFDSKIAEIRGKMAALLIAKGADVNAQNNGGLTPLHVAILSSNISVVQELLGSKVDIELKDKSGYSAFDYALNNHPQALWQLAGVGQLCINDPIRGIIE